MNSHALIEAADRCVLCGLCSSHCPTYKLFREEGESPRGRVMMSVALLRGEMEPSKRLVAHLDHCLLCRACEKSCPSGVPYGEILDGAHAMLPSPAGAAYWLEQIALRPRLVALLADGAALWRRLRLPLTALGRAATSRLPKAGRVSSHYPAVGKKLGKVGLFLGCVAGPFDRQTHRDAATLLSRLGYEVTVPQGQQCCGALPQHHGNPERAKQLNRMNQEAFGGQQLDAIIFTSSGCGVQLVEKGDLPAPAMEICQFLLQSPGLDRLLFSPLPQQITLHHPCSLGNVLRGNRAVEALLERIPKIKITLLGPDGGCCGAAGSHRLREPETADLLRQPKVESLLAAESTMLLSTNYGCALHLAEGIEKMGATVEVVHPVTLLVRQLDSRPSIRCRGSIASVVRGNDEVTGNNEAT